LVPTILALKIALSTYLEVEKETGVRLYPMLGTGSLPFRGGLTPNLVDKALEEYRGVATLILQSAFRYDYPLSQVKKAVSQIKKELPKRKPQKLSDYQIKMIKSVIPFFESSYRSSIEKLAPLINLISKEVAHRRERVLHIGLFGYSRGVGKVTLPRAIPFTGALYSLGIPPELIGTGRGIKEAKKKGLWNEVSSYYLHLRDDILSAGYFLNKENVIRLAKDLGGWYDIREDISGIEDELGIILGPKEPEHFEHYKLAEKIYEKIRYKKEISQLITYGGIIRRSLG
jgi:phosphoenolpyruvate carboxylase